MVSRKVIAALFCVACLCSVRGNTAPASRRGRAFMSGTGAHFLEHHFIPSSADREGSGFCANLFPYLLGAIAGIVFTVPPLLWLHRRHRMRLREQRALLGDELHDQLGPMIYYSRMLLTHEIRRQEVPAQSTLELQEQLAQIGEAVRDLSKTLRNEGATTVAALEAQLAIQLERWQKLGSASYVVHGEIPDRTLTLIQYTQLLRVLQEFALNSSRHAPGKSIHIGFEASRRRLRIRYWDEGPGLDPMTMPGTGSCSTVARMQRIGGTLEMDNRFPAGFEILLTLPL